MDRSARFGIRPLLAVAAVAAVIAGTADAANAAAILFTDFSSLAGLQVNGATKTIHGCASSGVGSTCGAVNDGARNVLRLTNNLGQSGSVFSTTTVSLDANASFSTAFAFRISDPQGISDADGQGADGIVFVVQTVSNTAGGAGGGIGYSGLSPSLGVEFDTWNNGGGDANNGNHIGINLNGNTSSNPLLPIATRMNNGADWYAWVDYDGTADALEVRLSQTAVRPISPSLTKTVDLVTQLGSTNVFVGFTSGTGAAGGDHDIVNWQFNSTFAPIETVGAPEPATLALAGLGLIALAALRRRRR